MRPLFRIAVATAMSISLVTPGFAYVADGTRTEHQSRRLVDSAARGANDIGAGLTRTMRTRKPAEGATNGRIKLRRATGRNFRTMNRKPKDGSDRYRTLHPNTRSLRRSAEGLESMLPGTLVQTGGLYDRPTRRDIAGTTNTY